LPGVDTEVLLVFFLFLDDAFDPSDLLFAPFAPLEEENPPPPCVDVGVGACEGVVWAEEGAGESYHSSKPISNSN
jgi:hypothetical protein